MNRHGSTPAVRRRPRPELCFGRFDLARSVIQSAWEHQSVLLFGGRQAGKTTLLKFIEWEINRHLTSSVSLGAHPLCVYVDLTMLPTEAGPSDFFGYLFRLVQQSCLSALEGTPNLGSGPEGIGRISDIDVFQSRIRELMRQKHGLITKVIFLLDESKRVLGSRFPRGFHDNLFSLLYGGSGPLSGRIAIVFSGAQELHALFEDETSPIGSRAAVHFATNLKREQVSQVVAFFHDAPVSDLEELTTRVFDSGGGHPGITVRFADRIASESKVPDGRREYDAIAGDVAESIAQLFRHWTNHFTPEACATLELLAQGGSISLKEMALELSRRRYSRFAADRVWQELQYVGVASEERERLIIVNSLYWEYRRRFGSPTDERASASLARDGGEERTDDYFDVADVVRRGESQVVEFKSTLRRNLQTGRNDPGIATSVLKTLAAFLNSDGGTLLIGVDDSGGALGVNEDEFSTRDRMNLHLVDLVTEQLGPVVMTFISAKFQEYDGLDVLVVVCRKSPKPVYLGREQDFYVRMGPSSRKLRVSDAYDYINERFRR